MNKKYCASNDCPYTDCDKHINQLKGQTGKRTFADFYKVCRKYICWLSYSNYQKYTELKEGAKWVD